MIPPPTKHHGKNKEKRQETVRDLRLFPDSESSLPSLRNKCLPTPRRTGNTNFNNKISKSSNRRTYWPSVREMGNASISAPSKYFTICNRCERRGDENPRKIWANNPLVLFNKLTDHLIEEHQLECAFCYLKFRDFGALAAHVLDAHKSEEERAQYRHFNPENPMEDETMLPAPGGGRARSTTPNSGGGRGGKQNIPFLRVEDLREEPSRAKILGVKTQDAGFNDLIVKVAINGKSYFFGLKASNENYEALFNAFGEDDNKWVGEEFLVGLKFNDFYDKNFVHVFKAPAPKAKKGE